MGKLNEKVAVITGGTSGMALATAKRFVEEGAYVFITGRRQEALDEAVKLIGRNVTGERGDAANLDDLDRLFDTVKREKGKIDVLFASAGMGEAAKLGEITEQHFVAAFGLNPRGTLFAVQKALPLFKDGGSFFLTGSVASVKGFPGFGVYSASKAALRSFARTWLNELKDRNIRVNVLSPGPIATPMQDQVLDEAGKRQFESLIPRGKMGRPEEIATVALFLASDDSSFVNGVDLSVDGGMSATRNRAEKPRPGEPDGALATASAVGLARPGPDQSFPAEIPMNPSTHSELIRFARTGAGSTVIDVWPGSGDWTRLFSDIVGPEGRVYSFLGAGRDRSFQERSGWAHAGAGEGAGARECGGHLRGPCGAAGEFATTGRRVATPVLPRSPYRPSSDQGGNPGRFQSSRL